MCWAIWLCQNDVVFHRTNSNSYLQVIFRGIYWTRFWSQLSEEEVMKAIKKQLSAARGNYFEVLYQVWVEL